MAIVACDIALSLDGYSAGVNQSLENPLGEGGEQLHRWMFEQPDANTAAVAALVDAGAFIMGRNMFGPGRGAWDESWRGWWGEEPPYHAPVFVLTHHPRQTVTMQGGTTFTFVTDGIHAALAQARQAARARDISIGGGAETVRSFLAAGLIDLVRVHHTPVLLRAGERPFVEVGDLTFEQAEVSSSQLVTHITYRVVH